MIFALFVVITVSALVVISACHGARAESPAPPRPESRRSNKKVRELVTAED